MCCGVEGNTLNPGPVPALELKGTNVASLKQRLKEIKTHPDYINYQKLSFCEPEYKEVYTPCAIGIRAGLVALLISGIAVYVLLLSGHLQTFPQDFVQWIHNINPINAAIGCGVTVVLIGGASWVIHRARTKVDPLLQVERGTIGDVEDHLKVVYASFTDKEGNPHFSDFYIDHSTVQGRGHEKGYLYGIKDPSNHYSISSIIAFLGTPVYFVGVVVYNALRTLIVPFYVLFQYVREKCVGTPHSSPMSPGKVIKKLYAAERSFELLDIPREMVKSIVRIVKAPFYALAFFMATLYSFVNPMAGRKLGAAIELDWNEDVTFAEGYWSVGGEQKLYQFEGGGGPDGLGRNGFYLAGCWQPVGIAEFEGGTLTRAYHLPKAIDSSVGYDYTIDFRSDLLRKVSEKQEAIDLLVAEAKCIQDSLDKLGGD